LAAGRRRKELTGDTDGRVRSGKPAILFEGDSLQPVEIAQDVAPFGGFRKDRLFQKLAIKYCGSLAP